MKKTAIFLALTLIIANLHAQTDCGNDLKKAFKSKFIINTENDIYNHFEELFQYSEKELNEMANKYDNGDELGGSYGAIAAYWSSTRKSKSKAKHFREVKIKHQAAYTIDNSFYEDYYEEIVSKDALDAYKVCLKLKQEQEIESKKLDLLSGGFYTDFVGDLLSGFTFVLNKKPIPGQIEIATIVSVTPSNVELFENWNLKPNAKIKNYTGISQKMRLIDPNRSGSITINIEGFDPVIVEFPAYPYANFPLGSIIISTLDFNSFSSETKNQMPYSAEKSKWAPADGRNVSNSDYGKTYNSVVPDMRGQFVRGKNQFFNSGEPNNYANEPDNGSRFDNNKYSYQKQATAVNGLVIENDGNHTHHTTANDYGDGHPPQANYTLGNAAGGEAERSLRYSKSEAIRGLTSDDGNHNHPLTGDKETRPNNIAVYYYIRINK